MYIKGKYIYIIYVTFVDYTTANFINQVSVSVTLQPREVMMSTDQRLGKHLVKDIVNF